MLCEFAAVAHRCLRAQDVPARAAREAWPIALLGENCLSGAREVAERLRTAWAQHEVREGETVPRDTVRIDIAAVEPEMA